MRLDHLLSRERIEEETRRFIPGRYTGNCVGSARADKKAEEAKKSTKQKQSGRMTVLLLEPASFSGIALNSREYGGLAQLGERLPCKQEVSGSIPLISTIWIDSSVG